MRSRFLLTIGPLLVPVTLAAQAPDLQLLRDSLRQAVSVPELRDRELALARADRTNASAMVERGMVLLRLYELTGDRSDADKARKSFEAAVEREPRSGWAHFGLGLALAEGRVRVPSPGGVLDGFVLGQSIAEVVGMDPLSRAGKQFLKAVELDPTLTPAAVEYANLALHRRNTEDLRRSRDMLERMLEDGLDFEDVRVALSRVQAALGAVDAAERTITAGNQPLSEPASLLAQAEALLRQPDRIDEGAAAYFRGIDALDAAAAEAYFDDVRMIATAEEIDEWEAADLEGRREWLRHFWDLRAARSGKTRAERLAEHYTRLATAQERFRRVGKRGASPGGTLIQPEYSEDQLPFDDRGLMYVRHGEPDDVVRTVDPNVRLNETWVYVQPDGSKRLHHFVVLRDGPDYRLVDDLMNAVDPSSNDVPMESIIELFDSRGIHDHRYAMFANRLNSVRNHEWAAGALKSIGANPGLVDATSDAATTTLLNLRETRRSLAADGRNDGLDAMNSDSDRPDFAVSLPFYYDVFTLKGKNDETDVTAAIAVPGSSLRGMTVGDITVYRLQVSLIVVDTLTGEVARRDTTFQFRSREPLRGNQLLRLHADVTAPTSRSSVHRLVLRDLNAPGTGQMYGSPTAVPGYTQRHLMISDLVLAEPGTGSWKRGDAALALVPPRQFFGGEPLTVFYELYNLPANTPYRTELELAPDGQVSGWTRLKRLLGGDGGRIRLSFVGTAALASNGFVQEIREITAELKPGKYRLSLKVTNLANGQVATAEKLFLVAKEEK